MSDFVMTPTDTKLLESLFRNPKTGEWTIPILTFNTRYTNPFVLEREPLHNDPVYQKRVIDHFYFKLIEKWLYKDVAFRKLLKYFRVERNGAKGTVNLIENPEDVNKDVVTEDDRKYIFKYIEKFFISKPFIDKVIRQFVRSTKIKWYDIFSNTDILKDYIAYKLKKLILKTIYELRDRQEKRKNT